MKKCELPQEPEQELEYQYAVGEKFFNDVVRKIIRQGHKEMRREDEEAAAKGGASEDSEN